MHGEFLFSPPETTLSCLVNTEESNVWSMHVWVILSIARLVPVLFPCWLWFATVSSTGTCTRSFRRWNRDRTCCWTTYRIYRCRLSALSSPLRDFCLPVFPSFFLLVFFFLVLACFVIPSESLLVWYVFFRFSSFLFFFSCFSFFFLCSIDFGHLVASVGWCSLGPRNY